MASRRPLLLPLLLAARAAAQVVPRGALTTSQLKLVADSRTKMSPTLQFGDVLADPGTFLLHGFGVGTGTATAQGLSLTHAATSLDLVTFDTKQLSVNTDVLQVDQRLKIEGSFEVNEVPQWRLVRAESFELGLPAEGWDNPRSMELVTECAGTPMLGGYKKFSKGEITKEFVLHSGAAPALPHTQLRVRAVFHFIDRWTAGDTGFARADIGRDGSMVHIWAESHTQETSGGVNLCGNPSVPEGRFAAPIDVVIPHSENKIKVGFGSNIEVDDPDDVSWGVSGVEIYIR